jgi:hypothetical protein
LGPFHIAGDLIQPFVNPRGLAVLAAFVIIALPVCVSRASSFTLSPASYSSVKLSALHFLFRMSYAQVLDVMLYTVFRQRRPCACSWAGGDFLQVGSTYGMPSGDSMSGALFAAWLWDMASSSAAPAARNNRSDTTSSGIMRCVAVAVCLAVMIERMSWGWHSLGYIYCLVELFAWVRRCSSALAIAIGKRAGVV